VELVVRLILAVAVSAPKREGCGAARLEVPGVPDNLVLRNRMRAMSAYRRQVRNSGMM